MHQSRVSTICLDVPSPTRTASEDFWSGALGVESRRGTSHPEYSVLGGHAGQRFVLQELNDGPARVHFDIHTDDRDSEVRRLTALGAREVERHDEWTVMVDPAGIIFCVVLVEIGDSSLEDARTWP